MTNKRKLTDVDLERISGGARIERKDQGLATPKVLRVKLPAEVNEGSEPETTVGSGGEGGPGKLEG